MIDTHAMALSAMLNINTASYVSGHSDVQYTMQQRYSNDVTGYFSPNGSWFEQQNGSGQNVRFVVDEPENGIEQKLDTIKKAFVMSEDELAQRLGVQRKTVFNWKKQQSSPKVDKAQLIFDLYLLAKNWLDAGFSTSSFDLNSPVLAGQSVKTMLHEATLDSEKILFAGQRLAHRSLENTDLF